MLSNQYKVWSVLTLLLITLVLLVSVRPVAANTSRADRVGEAGQAQGSLTGNVARTSAAKSALKYYWPRYTPFGRYTPPELTVRTEGSFANETMWLLHLAQPHATRPDVTIGGGVESGAPGRKLYAVTVRGQRGTAFATRAGYAVLWSENERVYSVSGTRSLRELLRIAEGLEALTRTTWLQRLHGAPIPAGLKYLWPRMSPLTVMPRGSLADGRGFVLYLAWPHATESTATISGGALVAPQESAGQRVRVRGQEGRLHAVGARRALVWTEDDHRYMIYSGLGRSDLLGLANDLEALDLQTFRQRLRPQ